MVVLDDSPSAGRLIDEQIKSERFIANSHARVGNVFLQFNAGGTNQKVVTANVTACLTAVATGAPPGEDSWE